MRYMATIYVSDVMESVALTLELQGWAGQFGAPETMLTSTYVWPGIGDDDPRSWLARALMEASISLTTPRSEGRNAAAPMGGGYTISGSSHRPI